MQSLKFVALDEEDLAIISTHLQDATVKVADVWRPQAPWVPRMQNFVNAHWLSEEVAALAKSWYRKPPAKRTRRT